MQIPQLSGVLTALATPYDDSGQLDLEALDKLVELLISNGVHALIPGGSSGEYYSQTLEERKAILARVAEIVKNRIPLHVGANSMRPEETIELAKFAEGLGYGAQLLAAPPYSLPGKPELIAHFRNIEKTLRWRSFTISPPAPAWTWTRSSSKASSISRRCNASAVSMIRLWTSSYGARAPGSPALPTSLPAEHVALYNACVEREDFLLGRKPMKTMMPLIYLMQDGGKYNQFKYGASACDVHAPLIGLSDVERSDKLYENLKSQKIASWVN
ncbi:dihydrodipicolinate synthase family protein [Mesorhizobium sp. Cs1299R1N1]|uniref:dihydrodipicolinate synthase family protein n=1 Tax=Mesorhizobium sp. Cs1299R1N1 TaxID=3015172 RepID=UPI00301B815F